MPTKKNKEKKLGKKFTKNKIPYQLLPYDSLEQVALVYLHGGVKYDPNNWRKGIPYSEIVGSILRHGFAWIRGQDIDPKSSLPHLAHLAWWCLTGIKFWLDDREDLDDRLTDLNTIGEIPAKCVDPANWADEEK